MAEGPFRIGLNEVEVGVVVPDGIQHLLRRVVGPYRAERLMVSGAMVDSATALAIGMVDETTEIDHVGLRARLWLEDLLAKPSAPMLATRRLARADLVAALEDPQRMDVGRFIDDWFSPETQQVLQAMVARLKAGKAGKPG
jgi:Delta3-Delta2-enoyl-CoA isomerase